jgi:hypothetical protein
MRQLTFAALAALALSVAAPAVAGELAGVTMDEKTSVGDQSLVLNGMALRSKAIFKVYVAGLYLPKKETSWQKVLSSDTSRKLVMHWVRSVGTDSICEAWNDALEANVANPSAQLTSDFETLCKAMEDAKTGDRYVFTYVPGEGTTIEVKGKKKATIEGKEFAEALFSSWIGEKPGPGEDFRAGLMGGGR